MRSKAGLVISLSCLVLALAIRPGVQAQQTPPAGPPAQGQGQPPAGAPGGAPGGGRAQQPPQNIKVLPKEWTRMQVQTVMQTFVESLGVAAPAGKGCLHCHATAVPPAGAPAAGAPPAGAPAAGAPPAAPPAAAPPAAAPPAGAPPAAGPGGPGVPGGGGQRGPVTDYASDTNPKKDIARKMIEMVMSLNEQTKAVGDEAVVEKVSCFTCHQGKVKPPITPENGWGRGSFSLLPAGPPARGRGGN